MEDLLTDWGETFDFLVEADEDSGAESADLLIADADGLIVITKSDTFTDGIADLSVPADEMEIEPGDYNYQVNITYEDGRIKKFPNGEDQDCDDGCQLVTLTVCETVDTEEGS